MTRLKATAHPAAGGGRLRDGGEELVAWLPARSLRPQGALGCRTSALTAFACFLVRHPRLPVTSEPLAARPAAGDGRPARAAATQRPPTSGERETAMTTPIRNDTTGPAFPEAVRWLLDGHSGRCGCTGQCGRTHDRRRCNADELAGLTVAPTDLTIPLEQAAVLPAEELVVWCHRCHDLATAAARRRRREQVEDELEDSQLGLWGAA